MEADAVALDYATIQEQTWIDEKSHMYSEHFHLLSLC